MTTESIEHTKKDIKHKHCSLNKLIKQNEQNEFPKKEQTFKLDEIFYK